MKIAARVVGALADAGPTSPTMSIQRLSTVVFRMGHDITVRKGAEYDPEKFGQIGRMTDDLHAMIRGLPEAQPSEAECVTLILDTDPSIGLWIFETCYPMWSDEGILSIMRYFFGFTPESVETYPPLAGYVTFHDIDDDLSTIATLATKKRAYPRRTRGKRMEDALWRVLSALPDTQRDRCLSIIARLPRAHPSIVRDFLLSAF